MKPSYRVGTLIVLVAVFLPTNALYLQAQENSPYTDTTAGGKIRTKGEQRRRKGFIGFGRHLLISFDYGQLRQVLMKLVVRLLTEGLLVRI